MRYTCKNAEGCFRRLARVMGKTIAEGNNYLKVGAWRFNYDAAYGGGVIEEIINEGGAITHPLTEYRLKPWEFCVMCWAIIKALEK